MSVWFAGMFSAGVWLHVVERFLDRGGGKVSQTTVCGGCDVVKLVRLSSGEGGVDAVRRADAGKLSQT